VLTSAYHLSERQLVRADCGAVGFVPKPFDLSELARFLKGKLPGPEVPREPGQGGQTPDGCIQKEPPPGPFEMRGAAA
jgi:hypothetical protein